MDLSKLVGIDRLAGDLVADAVGAATDSAFRNAADDLYRQAYGDTFRAMADPVFGLEQPDPFRALGAGLAGAYRDFAGDLARSVAAVDAGLAMFTEPALPAFGVGAFIDSLPDLGPLVGAWVLRADVEEGAEALDEGGFGFTEHLWTDRFLASMARVAPRVRGAAVTNRLRAHTAGAEFAEELGHHFGRSSILRRRWPAVERALAAHRRRDYLLSVHALLPQVEGVLGDALIVKNAAARRGRRLYEKGPDGRLKRDRNGDPIEINRAGRLVERSGYKQHPVLVGVADLLSTYLIEERHAVLHGRKVAYGTARLSSQTLYVLLLLAADVAAFEAGETGTEGRD